MSVQSERTHYRATHRCIVGCCPTTPQGQLRGIPSLPLSPGYHSQVRCIQFKNACMMCRLHSRSLILSTLRRKIHHVNYIAMHTKLVWTTPFMLNILYNYILWLYVVTTFCRLVQLLSITNGYWHIMFQLISSEGIGKNSKFINHIWIL